MRRLLMAPFALFLCHFMVSATAEGQNNSVDEYKLKAAMLYNLTKYVEWPDSAYAGSHAPIFLCILGQDPFANSLTSIVSTETVNSRAILLRHLQRDTDTKGCHVLYIGSSERKSTPRILSALNGTGILTVGEMTQFAALGGMIQFSLQDQHVRFDINLNAASRAGLSISSKLLALAQIVKN